MNQPAALRLADAVDPLTRSGLDNLTCAAAAAELRRLYAENEELRAANEAFGKRQEWCNEQMFVLEEQHDSMLYRRMGFSAQIQRENEQLTAQRDALLEALKMAVRQNDYDMLMTGEELRQCCAAIAAAEGEKK